MGTFAKDRKSPRPHPFLGRFDGGIRFPQGGAFRMKAGSNRDGVIIFVFIIPRSFEQFAEGQDGPRGLVLSFIDSSGEGISNLIYVAVMSEGREGEGLFPEQVNHVFKVIDRLLAKQHVLGKWVGVVAPVAFKIPADQRRGEFRFAHRHG